MKLMPVHFPKRTFFIKIATEWQWSSEVPQNGYMTLHLEINVEDAHIHIPYRNVSGNESLNCGKV